MSAGETERVLATVAVSYAKRWMEAGVYDRLFQTNVGQEAKQLGAGTRYGIEAAMYVAGAVLIRQSDDDGVLAGALKELGSDVAPELAKRLVNRQQPPAAQLGDLVTGLSPEEVEILDRWVSETTQSQRQEVIDRLAASSFSDLVRVADIDGSGNSEPSPTDSEETPGRFEYATAAIRGIRGRVARMRRAAQRQSDSEEHDA